VFVVCCAGSGLWDELITGSGESHRVCVCVCMCGVCVLCVCGVCVWGGVVCGMCVVCVWCVNVVCVCVCSKNLKNEAA